MAPRSPTGRLLALIQAANAIGDLDTFRREIPTLLRAAVPADTASYNEFDDDPARVWWTTDPHLVISEELGVRFTELIPEHPLLAHIARTGDGSPRRISDFMTQTEFHASRLYREFYRHVGVERQIGMALPARAPVFIGLALMRSGADFTDADVTLLATARPHLIQAYRNAELAHVRDDTIAALEAGLEALGAPVLVAEERGYVTMATPGARRLLERRLGAPGETSRLAPDVREALARHRLAGRPSTEPLRLPDGESTLTLRVLRGPRAATDLLIVEPGNAGLSVVALQGIGLSRREAEALRWVALGRRGAEIAAAMGIAPRTVQKHLENTYAKLGVNSASQAAATAWAAVGVRLPQLPD